MNANLDNLDMKGKPSAVTFLLYSSIFLIITVVSYIGMSVFTNKIDGTETQFEILRTIKTTVLIFFVIGIPLINFLSFGLKAFELFLDKLYKQQNG